MSDEEILELALWRVVSCRTIDDAHFEAKSALNRVAESRAKKNRNCVTFPIDSIVT
jgi:hypothetical protein